MAECVEKLENAVSMEKWNETCLSLANALRSTQSRSKRKLLDTAADCIMVLTAMQTILIQCAGDHKVEAAVAALEKLLEEST